MTYRLFFSPRGFANSGTIYEFDSIAERDAALAALTRLYCDNPQVSYYPITASSARHKLTGDAATESYVHSATATEFAEWMAVLTREEA